MGIFGSIDARALAPVGSYQTDKKRLVEILEVDTSGALGEDQLTHELIEISPLELRQRWRRVHPLADEHVTGVRSTVRR